MHPYSLDIDERPRTYFILALISVGVTYIEHRVLSANRVNPAWYIDVPSFGVWFAAIRETFDRWLWACSVKGYRLFSSIPTFVGAYHGQINLHLSGGDRPPVDIRLLVDQRWSKIRIVGETIASTAVSEMAYVSIRNAQLRYEFIDEPKPAYIDKYHIHRGVSYYRKEPPKYLTGGFYNYVNDAKQAAHGDISLEKLDPEEAKAMRMASMS